MVHGELRVLTTRETYPDFSVSTSPALERSVREGQSPATVCLNLLSDDGVAIGFNEDPDQVVDLDYCRAEGIVVRRRPNSGGAVYASKGSAFLAFYLPMSLPGVPATAAEAFPRFLGNAAHALREVFGVRAFYRPLNNVQIDGRALLPASVKFEEGVLTARMLLNVTPIDSYRASRAVLYPDDLQIGGQRRREFSQGLTALETELGRSVVESELHGWADRVLRDSIGGQFRIVEGGLTDNERQLAVACMNEMATDGWLYARSERVRLEPLRRSGDVIGRGLKVTPVGVIRMALLVRDGRIVEAVVNGGWPLLPLQSVEWLEAGMRGMPATVSGGEDYLVNFVDRSDIEFAGVEASDFIAAFAQAVAAANAAGPRAS